jgi:hypothetical protein
MSADPQHGGIDIVEIIDKLWGYIATGFFMLLSWLGRQQIKRIDNVEATVREVCEKMVSKETMNYTVNDIKTDIRTDIQGVKDEIVELRSVVMQSIAANRPRR